MTDYREDNLSSWDERAPAHAVSPGYAVASFISDPEFLSEVVRFDLPLLGDVKNLRGVHLQCHIGTDTISLARLGARMTGLDFSGAAIAEARSISERAKTPVNFIQSDLYAATEVLQAQSFDLVFTGIGALCWLPDIRRWAGVVSSLLRPGGRLFIREGHPMLWAVDETQTDRLVIDYPYFERAEPVSETSDGTYVPTDAIFENNRMHSWNHALGEVVTALIDSGLQITGLVEHDSVPWEAVPGLMTKAELGEWRLTERPWRLAHSYTLQAVKG